MLFQYDGTLLPQYVVSYPIRLQYQSAELQIHQISNSVLPKITLKIYHESLKTVSIFILSTGMELQFFFFQEYKMMISSKKVKNKELKSMF